MRTMVVTCENGDRFSTEIEDGESLRITGSGNIRLISETVRANVCTMESPAVSVHELVEHNADA